MYVILEIQTNNGTTTPLTPVTKATKELAQQELYTKASYAAVSNVQIHTVMMINAEGQTIEKLCFKHEG